MAYKLRIFSIGAEIALQNDELLIYHEGDIFQYTKPKLSGSHSQGIQQSLFNLKKSIIENCLFGVDINPNSCEITKLRLWIELLKHSYYKIEDNQITNELQTLPNIDINIKCGNSLLSYFDLEQDFRHIPNIKERISRYKKVVQNYKEGDFVSKSQIDREIKDLLEAFKNFCFRGKYKAQIKNLDNACEAYRKKYGDYLAREDKDLDISYNPFPEYDLEASPDPKIIKEASEAFAKIKASHNALYNLESNHPFEWRFAFPEVLDDNGNFTGFDCVIGNPPYVVKNKNEYPKYQWNSDLYLMFFEMGFKLVRTLGYLSYITPRFWLVNANCKSFRDFMLHQIDLISLTETNPFDVAVTENIIALLQKNNQISSVVQHYKEKNEKFHYIKDIDKAIFRKNLGMEIVITHTPELLKIFTAIEVNTILLGDIMTSKRGAEYGKQFIKTNKGSRKILLGYDLKPYSIEWENTFIDSDLSDIKRLESFFNTPNLIFLRRVDKRLTASISNECFAFIKNIYGLSIENAKYDYRFVLALLNSRLLNFYYLRKFTTKKEEVFPEIQTYLYNQLPIPKIDSANQSIADKIIALVDEILATKDKNPKADTTKQEKQIDKLVYTLYNLTDEEIELIEKG